METGRQLLNGWMDGYLFFLIFHLLVHPQIGSEAETCILESTPQPGERHLRFTASDEAARLQDQPPLKGLGYPQGRADTGHCGCPEGSGRPQIVREAATCSEQLGRFGVFWPNVKSHPTINAALGYCARSSAHVIFTVLCAYFARFRRLNAAAFLGPGRQGCAEIGQYAGPSPLGNPQRAQKGPDIHRYAAQ